jgi:hypothetical protein
MKATAAAALFLLTLNGQYNNVSPTSTLRMDLFNGEEKCIGQDFDIGDKVVFKIGASSKSDHGHSQTLRVTVRLCIYVYIYMYIYAYAYMYIYIHIHTYIHIYKSL